MWWNILVQIGPTVQLDNQNGNPKQTEGNTRCSILYSRDQLCHVAHAVFISHAGLPQYSEHV